LAKALILLYLSAASGEGEMTAHNHE
jgi:hypothetical protein